VGIDGLDKISSEQTVSDWSGWRASPPTKASLDDKTLFNASTGHVLWRVSLPAGSSSPTVWADQVIATFATRERHVGVTCVDRLGSVLWKQTLAEASGPTHHKTGYAASTPATNGQFIYCSFGEIGLFCLSMEGKLIWHAGAHQVHHEWGHAASPLLAGNLIIQLADGQSGSFIAAYDAQTGQRKWKTDRDSNGCWSSPILFKHPISGRQWVVVNGSGRNSGPGELTGYDLTTGKPAWSVAGTSNTPAPTAVIEEDLIISASGNNGPIMAVRINAFDETRVVWRRAAGGPYVPTGTITNQLFLQIGDTGRLSCYSTVSGKRRWSTRLRGQFTASLVNTGDHVLATSERGELFFVAFDGDSFEVTATYSLGERTLATPTLAGGRLYVRTARHLICMGRADDASRLSVEKQPATAAHVSTFQAASE
jgi:outer membrane protein assembly factor BamB